jgi:hypothetical protein
MFRAGVQELIRIHDMVIKLHHMRALMSIRCRMLSVEMTVIVVFSFMSFLIINVGVGYLQSWRLFERVSCGFVLRNILFNSKSPFSGSCLLEL